MPLSLCNVTLGPVLIEANSQYLFCYITEISILHSALPVYSNP